MTADPAPGRPAWYLPVGDRLDPERAALLVETFRPEVVRVGRALRAKVERERLGARPEGRLYSMRDLLHPHGYARTERLERIALAHLHYQTPPGPQVDTIVLEWETGRVFAVIGGKPWEPEEEAWPS